MNTSIELGNLQRVDFEGREAYREWRAAWKRNYRATSDFIRAVKGLRAEYDRNGRDPENLNAEWREVYDAVAARMTRALGGFGCPSSALPWGKDRARKQMALLKDAKAEAQRQWLAAKRDAK